MANAQATNMSLLIAALRGAGSISLNDKAVLNAIVSNILLVLNAKNDEQGKWEFKMHHKVT